MAICQRLKAWEHCHQLCVAVYETTNNWPTAELKILPEDHWAHLDELHRMAGGMTWLLYRSLLAKEHSSR